MFSLIFFVGFGAKRGVLTTYQLNWMLWYNSIFFFSRRVNYATMLAFYRLIWRFQFSILTAKSSVLVLLGFWIFFLYGGEGLLLVVFNWMTVDEVIVANSFLILNTPVLNFLSMSVNLLSCTLFKYIYFLSFFGLGFLLNCKYNFTYRAFKYQLYYEMGLIVLIVFIFILLA